MKNQICEPIPNAACVSRPSLPETQRSTQLAMAIVVIFRNSGQDMCQIAAQREPLTMTSSRLLLAVSRLVSNSCSSVEDIRFHSTVAICRQLLYLLPAACPVEAVHLDNYSCKDTGFYWENKRMCLRLSGNRLPGWLFVLVVSVGEQEGKI